MENVRKKDLVEVVARLGNTTKTEAEEMLNTVIMALEEVAIDELKGFTLGALGSFRLVDVKAREYAHPNDPTKVTVKGDRKNLRFKINKSTQASIEERTSN